MNHNKDKIKIKDLLLRCIIGINDDERIIKQDVVINITLYCDLSISGSSDNISDTVNYKKIKNRIVTIVENSSYYLIERLAQAIADICLENSLIEKVIVSVDKPGVLRFAKSVSVEIERNRQEP
jgi:FolB domain-containing protein